MSADLFKPPEPGEGKKLQPHQVCAGCGKHLEPHQWAKRGLPGLCDDCAREHSPRA